MRIYIAGPMQGYANFNFDAFNKAAEYLRGQGYEVINPAENFDGRQDLPYQTYIDKAMEQVATVDLIVKLPGWESSKGVKQELKVAFDKMIDHTTYQQFTGQPGPQNAPDFSAFLGAGPVRDGGEVDEELFDVRAVDAHLGTSPFTGPSEPCLCRDCSPYPPMPEPEERITDEAWGLVVEGERQSSYGHPQQDFQTTGRQWGALLDNWLKSEGLLIWKDTPEGPLPVSDGALPDLPPKLVALMMTQLKLSRESHSPKHDNLVDAIGYLICADRIEEGY